MENSKIDNINICIWGLGYLGYSNIIKYTNNGINLHISEFGIEKNKSHLIKNKQYPSNKLKKDFEYNKDSKPNFDNLIFKSNQYLFSLNKAQSNQVRDSSEVSVVGIYLSGSENTDR